MDYKFVLTKVLHEDQNELYKKELHLEIWESIKQALKIIYYEEKKNVENKK